MRCKICSYQETDFLKKYFKLYEDHYVMHLKKYQWRLLKPFKVKMTISLSRTCKIILVRQQFYSKDKCR